MLSAARFAAMLFLGAVLLIVRPGWATEACADGPAVPTHRIESSPPLPVGTVRPTVRLVSLQQSTEPAATVVLDGVILPAKAGETSRLAYSNLMAHLRDTSVAFVASGNAPDRRGRLHGSIRFEDGDGLGERLLAAGAGLTDVSFTPCAPRFLAAEARARAEKRGIWRQSRIWTDLNAAVNGLPDFVLGRGKVASIGQSGRTTYINFGGNFRTDATVRLREAMASALVAAGRPPESLSGRIVEVRGWANRRDGLDIELNSPLALRLPDEASGTGAD